MKLISQMFEFVFGANVLFFVMCFVITARSPSYPVRMLSGVFFFLLALNVAGLYYALQ